MKITAGLVRGYFPPRKKDAHKRDFGLALIAAGSRGMSGAAVLCANACARGGAGLTTLAVPEPILGYVLARTYPEIMILPLPAVRAGTVGERAASAILDYASAKKAGTIAIGPGLGVNAGTSFFVREILQKFSGCVVLDADGINSIEEKDLARARSRIIITPHPGEFRRITKTPRAGAAPGDAVSFAARNRVICVLKGSGTIVTDGSTVLINPTGNPGMAKGGSGDVLTGLIAAFTGQTKGLLEAAAAGVYLHGLAGDISARRKTMTAMLPSDIIENLPEAFKRVELK
jgi:NAD(P)H-hydrate epimerase